jgi:hypothetical protein
MIQAVAEGGMEEVSDDTRVEARFGGRIGYAGGGISNVAIARETLQSRAPEGEFLAYINPEEAGILKALGGAGQDINATGVPSFFVKKVFKAAKSVVKGAAKAVKSVAKSPIGKENYLDALKQVSGAAMDYPLTTIGGISTLASAMTPEIPEQLPGESMEEYRARVAEFERQYASNLSGRTGPSLPASANNPFYPVYAARGGRIGYLFGGSGVSASAVAQPVEGQSMPVSGGRKRYWWNAS